MAVFGCTPEKYSEIPGICVGLPGKAKYQLPSTNGRTWLHARNMFGDSGICVGLPGKAKYQKPSTNYRIRHCENAWSFQAKPKAKYQKPNTNYQVPLLNIFFHIVHDGMQVVFFQEDVGQADAIFFLQAQGRGFGGGQFDPHFLMEEGDQ